MSSGISSNAQHERRDLTTSASAQSQNRLSTPNLIAHSGSTEAQAEQRHDVQHGYYTGNATGTTAQNDIDSRPYPEHYDHHDFSTQLRHGPYANAEQASYLTPNIAPNWAAGQSYDQHLDVASHQSQRLAPTASYGYAQLPYQYDPSGHRLLREPGLHQHVSQSQFGPNYSNYLQHSMQSHHATAQAYPARAHASYGRHGGPYSSGSNYPQTSPIDAHFAYQGQQPGRQLPFRAAPSQGQSSRMQSTTFPVTDRHEYTPSYPRGPPRKPKQSGFAVWVGNLSPGTTIEHLKDFFSRGATKDIESVFFISKSNCAFVNYRSPESAQAAVARFHDARLNGVRLVCRLRHGQASTTSELPQGARHTSEAGGTSSQAGAMVTSKNQEGNDDDMEEHVNVTSTQDLEGGLTALEITKDTKRDSVERVVEKIFIVKSLTLQDLEASVRNGIWATQSHNEDILNKAFESAQNVYLVFSANKSGEYFGYARMRSAISVEKSATPTRTTRPSTTPGDGPTSTPTPATENAPAGRIVDDSARGTIFWEADSFSGSDDGVGGQTTSDATGKLDKRRAKLTQDAEEQDWGKPFEIEWVCTSRLPFYRTRGLRNPWNANREIKIARDGTELEPVVGRRLLDMFHETAPAPTNFSGVSFTSPSGPMIAMGSTHSTGMGHSTQ